MPHRAKTPNWDIASICKIDGAPGLLLIEAKANADELNSGKSRPTTENSRKNHKRIGQAIDEASAVLEQVTGKP